MCNDEVNGSNFLRQGNEHKLTGVGGGVQCRVCGGAGSWKLGF
jgi:hypothetical protein